MKRILIVLSMLSIVNSIVAINPSKKYRMKPEWWKIVYDEVTFKTKDGYKLKGWFFPAQDSSKLLANADTTLIKKSYKVIDHSKKPTIVICGGDAQNMSWLIYYAIHLITKGYNVFTFDWRGFGESDDWKISRDYLCYTEFLLDYDAAVDYIKDRNEVDISKIGVFGFSTGAYLSFAIATKRKDISAFAGRGLMTSFEEVIPLLKKIAPDKNFIVPDNYPKNLEPILAAESIKIPVFLVVGEKDVRTPPWMAEKIKSKIKSPCELWITPNAEHGGANGPEWIDSFNFFSLLVKFYKKYL